MFDKDIIAVFREIGIIGSLAHVPDALRAYVAAREIGRIVNAYTYDIEDGCVENLDYETHSRGKNWIAFVRPDRSQPGGLAREFWKHGSKAWFAAPRAIVAGDVIEMAGDYYTGRGGKRPDRRYILVVRVEAVYFVGVFLGETAPSAKRVTEESRRYGLAA